MKKIYLIITLIITVCITSNTNGQKKIRNLKIYLTPEFNPNSSITVEGLTNDNAGVANYLRSALLIEGFKVISDRTAKERLEMKNKGQIDSSNFYQEISIGKTKYINSVYLITMQYSTVPVLGCGNGVGIDNISGQIIDLLNEGNIVATFTYKMSMINSQCPETIMESLANSLKNGKSVK